MDCISEDQVVLIQRDKIYRPFKLKKGRKLHFEKVKFYPDGALGERFGSCFKVDKQQLVLVEDYSAGTALSKEGEFGADNRSIQDDGKAQELTETDIKDMKGCGMSGEGIVKSMVEHSASFKDKTKYSQQKYIRKKEKKYNAVFRIVRTTTLLLCELYFSQTPVKTYYLRKDSLAQLLTMSNVHANSNMLVMETCQGFVAGAMLERMGGLGKLVQIFYGDYPVRIILDNFGHLSAEDRSILNQYPFHRVGSLLSPQEAQQVMSVSEGLVSPAPPEAGAEESSRRGKRTKDSSQEGEDDTKSAEGQPSRKKLRTDRDATETVNKEGEVAERERIEATDIVEKGREVTESGGPAPVGGVAMDSTEANTVAEVGGGQERVVEGHKEGEKVEEDRNRVGEGGEEGVEEQEEVMDLEEGQEKCEGQENVGEGQMDGQTRGQSSDVRSQDSSSESVHKKQHQDDHLKKEKRQQREERYKYSEDLLKQRKMDGLVVVCRHHPLPVVTSLLNFLAPSRPFAVYCHLLEPLVQCCKSLKDSPSVSVFNLQISESWMRKYQVLPDRTHPEMQMDGQSGYLLTGVTVKQFSKDT